MDQHYNVAALEVVTIASYMVIAAGFGYRRAQEGQGVSILWPWLLMAIFVLCGITRAIAFLSLPFAEVPIILGHYFLAAMSVVYGVGQLMFALRPQMFDPETTMPRLVDVKPSESHTKRS